MSEESDIEDRVASDQDDRSDDFYSGEFTSESEEANEFLDMEAAESDGQSEDGDESSSDDTESVFFPQFTRLPPELRARVWEYFDIHLRTKARVFEIMPCLRGLMPRLTDGPRLVDQTAPARAMLATHQESRALALKSYPDTLDMFGGRGIFRYNSAKDVLYLTGTYRYLTFNFGDLESTMSLINNPSYVALSCRWGDFLNLQPSPQTARKLRSIFRLYDAYDFPAKDLQWCVSDSVHRMSWRWEEDEIGLPRVVEDRFCWPDLEDHRDFAVQNVRPGVLEVGGVEIWPMIEFVGLESLDRYDKLQVAVSTEGEWCDKWSSDSGSEDESVTEDEYESEGIDDATIDGDEVSSEDDDDLVVQSDSEENALSNYNAFSPLQDENPEANLEEQVGEANFSSLEPESPTPGGDESEHAASDEEPVVKTSRRKRRVVSSDDEHESQDERNETAQLPSRPAKRSRVVLSDTEDEDNENGNENGVFKHGGNTADESEDDGSSEEESDGSNEEEREPAKPKPMSLFEKLRQFRDEVPVSPDSGAGSDAGESMDNEDFSEGSNTVFPDDEIDEEEELLENDEILRDMPESGDEDEW
ncbi:hypothetical protein F5Y05DRAFT_60276 [Hypoxylon sp. FL0543]|nr:hypothetical protein F5Y05DRAFT_60276 [Hypoxylon sp. FL0543]